MFEHRRRAMVGIALIVIFSALMGLLALSSGAGVFSELAFAAELSIPPFAERLEEAGSLEALVSEAPDGWVPVGPGVDYRLFQLEDPNNIHVARMDRSNGNVFIESSIAQGRLSGGLERTSSQFDRYEGAINYWGQAWGKTNDVLVAINGSFYTVDGVPDRGVIHSGWYAKRFTDNENGSGFFWKLDGTAYIGQCVVHVPEKQVITYLDNMDQQKYQGINTSRGDDDLIIYTPQFDRSTGTNDSGVEILVEMSRPALVYPLPKFITGTVKAIYDSKGNTPIPFDHIVLSATGPKRTKLLQNLAVDDLIGVSSGIKHLSDDDCETGPVPGDWSKAYAAVGGSFYFLQNGTIATFDNNGANVRNPRTAIAFNDDYIFFIVVDGRDPEVSVGMNMTELGAFAKNHLGAVHGINQDGGGSSTMVIDGVVINTPSDSTEVACRAIYLPLIVGPGESEQPSAIDQEEGETFRCYGPSERWVANGMMMVLATPQSSSTAYLPGQPVVTTVSTPVYLGPGTNYAVLTNVDAGTNGIIKQHTNGLDGVFAKGTYWWKVNFSGTRGWVPESNLAAVP